MSYHQPAPRAVLPVEWVEESTRAHEELYTGHGYGYLWHVPEFKDVPGGVFNAERIETKVVSVVPDLDVDGIRIGAADPALGGSAFLGLISQAVNSPG